MDTLVPIPTTRQERALAAEIGALLLTGNVGEIIAQRTLPNAAGDVARVNQPAARRCFKVIQREVEDFNRVLEVRFDSSDAARIMAMANDLHQVARAFAVMTDEGRARFVEAARELYDTYLTQAA